MKICTITCHDVYNHGASLQAYALMTYLSKKGHDVEIINYKPPYLSNHYNLFSIDNLKWKKSYVMKLAYLTLKLPSRLNGLKRKKAFDRFTNKNLLLTSIRYASNEEIKKNLPDADVFICGSDQIWNCLHENGKDPAFYLDFVSSEKLKFSYAASFATEDIPKEYREMVREKVRRLNGIGVRESSGVEILKNLKVNNAVQVVDPVFLLNTEDWESLTTEDFKEKYVLVYDFDNSKQVEDFAKRISVEKGLKIYTINPGSYKYSHKNYKFKGPETFVSLIKNAEFVISNSFHAAVFSIIYEKDFVIVNRTESINTRMRDLLNDLGIGERMIENQHDLERNFTEINYQKIRSILKNKIQASEDYIEAMLNLNQEVKNIN